MAPVTGTSINQYVIAGRIGAGGMGEVFRARDTRLHRDVAMKVLPRDFGADTDRLRRFEQEAKTLAALNHPNVLTIHDAGVHEGAPYLVSELLEGNTLREELDSGTLPVRKALDYALQIAHGLAAAHAKGVVHRDLKPANIFVTRDGRVKILDFGLAKLRAIPKPTTGSTLRLDPAALASLTESGRILGTPAYMSPEQVRGEPADHRSDLFAFGTILCEMFGGQHPFQRGTMAETMAAVLNDDPMELPQAHSATASGLWRIVERCLEKQPERRFQSAQDLAFTIGNAAQTIATPAVPRVSRDGDFAPAESDAQKSLAVLPFANMSDDRENEFLADGITEDLITALSRVKDLRVPARTSSFAFKGKNEDIRRIGQLLSVETLLEGSVRKAGNRLRITAQLVKVRDGFQLWSERYDREMKDVFDIQDDITRAIVGALEVRLGGGTEIPFVQRQTASTLAYELYAQGRIHCSQRGIGLLKALHYFELALLEDPNYAQALAGLSESLGMSAFYGLTRPSDVMPRALAVTAKLVQAAPDLAAGHAMLGWLNMSHHWDWPAAERCFQRAFECNPKYAPAHFWYAGLMGLLGRGEESVASGVRAVELDPLSPGHNIAVVWWSVFARRITEATEKAQRVIARWPEVGLGYVIFADCLILQGRTREAVLAAEQGAQLSHRSPMSLGRLGMALVRAGEHERARTVLAELLQARSPWQVSFHDAALIQWRLGEKAAAATSFQRAFEEREPVLPFIFAFPLNDELRGDPVFEELRRKLGLSA